ncbi:MULTISPECIES: hypothetical protein [unclassified Streptomyces]|uniref:hypothetical protein n=1 Tax=unclassified Streptomyces TaxID=2593676 RepID=UPI003BB5040E
MSPRTAARAVRRFVRGTGRHRPGSTPKPAVDLHEMARDALPDEGEFEQLLADGEIEANECAHCPTCARTTFHAMHTTGSRTCWTCATTTAGEQ